ncbi:hypothetical protein [Clostridium rectalis]|uniref:hypothetical protein n=1 Tax=Clostridium rectalis TaxID=2040295 RepID=UPI000F633D59|nr:hypothetical protein [Clostridium rectalis]
MKIDLTEEYKDGNCLTIPNNAICCYACLNYKFDTDYECEKHGHINSLVSSRCDEYETILLEDD